MSARADRRRRRRHRRRRDPVPAALPALQGSLQEQDANVARYEQWRGGLRSDSKTGASVAMEILRRQLQIAGGIIGAGVVAIVIGFILR